MNRVNLQKHGRIAALAGLLGLSILGAVPLQASGDLLVAPTRVVFDGKRGAEVILNNVGAEEATYRISLELRRMNDQGRLDDVPKESANATENNALGIIQFAPRRVTLPPNQPQSIRIGIKGLEALPDGEYRAHMLFRAIPKAMPVGAPGATSDGLKIQLIPVYGVAIPIIVRKGALRATAALANPRVKTVGENSDLQIDLSREGTKSVYGDLYIMKPGVATPVTVFRGIAAYPELKKRLISLPLDPLISKALHGEIVISYREPAETGGAVISEIRTVLP
jgi:P pilus assembly chaperone PapD